MKILRTPEERFLDLVDFPYEPHYYALGDLRLHYVDEGPAEASPVLMMHGEPTWSYLYRKMIPIVVAAGHRVIAPDLIGFGRSDKPASIKDHSYQKHVDWMKAFVEGLDLQDITLVCQDWGSLIGLRLLAAMPDRFARVVVANGGLPVGKSLGRAFQVWCAFSQWSPLFPIGRIVDAGATTKLSPKERAAYDAPFPDSRYKGATRAMPALVPASPEDPGAKANLEAWKVLEGYERPFLTAFSNRDPITRGQDKIFQARIPGAQGQPHTLLRGGGHFLQEDCGPEFARVIVAFIDATS